MTYEEKNEKRRALARKYLDDPTDMQNLNELFGLIRPLAVFVMKEHEKIPSLEKDDYMQIADITAWKVLERIRVKPDIIDNFEAYVVAAIRNGYIAEYRKYVFKSLLESKSYTRKNSSLNAAYLYSMEEYVEKIAEKRRAYVRDFRKKHLELCRQRDRDYWNGHKDKKREKDRRYREKHKEKLKIQKREYKRTHREEINARARKYRAENGDAVREKRREYYQKTKEHQKAYREAYKKANPEKVKAYRDRYYNKNKEQILAKSREYKRRKRAEEKLKKAAALLCGSENCLK